MWSNDYDNRFPWQVSTNAIGRNSPGTLELITLMSPAIHFQVASNEIGSPTLLTCPSDRDRQVVSNWSQLTRTNISYFINLEANTTNQCSTLIGDRNLAINNKAVVPGLIIVTADEALKWDGRFHGQIGNIGFGDGSVQQVVSKDLNPLLRSSGVATNRFVIP